MVGKRKYLSSGMSENPALERGSVRSCTGRNLKRMEVEAITVHSSRKNLLPFSTMDISELLARFNADRPLVINRAGSATVARLACAAVSSGRRVAVVVRSREELASMRGLGFPFHPGTVRRSSRFTGTGKPSGGGSPVMGKTLGGSSSFQYAFAVPRGLGGAYGGSVCAVREKEQRPDSVCR